MNTHLTADNQTAFAFDPQIDTRTYGGEVGFLSRSDIERFWDKVDKSGDCWLWTACYSRKGYGRFRYEGKLWQAHRISWTIHFGEIPTHDNFYNTMCVCHHCDVPRCVQPSHLFLGSIADNISDRDRKGRTAQLKGELNGRSKLTEKDVVFIRESSLAQAQLAAIFGVNRSVVSKVKSRKLWAHM